jgi:hypothetical protein
MRLCPNSLSNNQAQSGLAIHGAVMIRMPPEDACAQMMYSIPFGEGSSLSFFRPFVFMLLFRDGLS